MAQKRITDLEAATALTGDELVEVSQLSAVVTMTGATISAAATDNSYNDSGAGFIAAGFAEGDRVNVAGFTGNVVNNILVGIITTLTAGKMIIGGTDGDVIVDDAAGESVTISKWVSRRAMAQDIADLAEAGGGTAIAVNDQTDSYTAVLGDANDYVRLSKATAVTFTIPTNAAVAYPVGTRLYVEQGGAGVVTIAGAVGVTVQSRGAVYDTAGQHAVAVALKIAADIWTLSGDLA